MKTLVLVIIPFSTACGGAREDGVRMWNSTNVIPEIGLTVRVHCYGAAKLKSKSVAKNRHRDCGCGSTHRHSREIHELARSAFHGHLMDPIDHQSAAPSSAHCAFPWRAFSSLSGGSFDHYAALGGVARFSGAKVGLRAPAWPYG